MKVLVISQPVWKNENNSGNTLSNIFSGFGSDFCNIYCAEGYPNNSVCKEYHQITDYMVLQNVIKGKKIGQSFNINEVENIEEKSFETKAKRHKNSFSLLLRELAWKVAKVENDNLFKFIDYNKPDLIYAPTYGNLRMLRLVRNIKKKTGLPLVSYISDDLYNYKSNMNLIERFSHKLLRKSLKESFSLYDLVYTMTEEQKEEYERIFGREIKILRKSSVTEYKKHKRNDVLRIIFAGGTYEGREKTLVKLAEEIKELNKDKKRFKLDIYTGNIVERIDILDDKDNCEVHGLLSYDDLLKEYQNSDVGLHCESFENEEKERCRLSFSTKILDCLQSGGATLAICPSDNAGFKYLQREDAAVCIDNFDDIEAGLIKIYNEYERYQDKAYDCLTKNHDRKKNLEQLKKDFEETIEGYKG